MRRWILPSLFVIVLVSPFVLKLFIHSDSFAATGDGGSDLRLVIVTPHNQDICREYAVAFSAWHQEHYGEPVNIDYRSLGGTVQIVRQIEGIYKPWMKDGKFAPDGDVSADIDLVWGGGEYEFRTNFYPYLQPMDLDPEVLAAAFPQRDLAGINLYDADKTKPVTQQHPRWVGVCLSSFGIVYNPDLYATLKLEPPKTWDDLARPELFKLVALADPQKSGSAAVAYLMVLQRKMTDAELAGRPLDEGWQQGMRTLTAIAANARYFTDSSGQVLTDVANGDAAAGMAIDFYGRVTQEAVGAHRIQYVSPPAATAITPDPIGILEGITPQRKELAERFVTFLLTPQGQRLWNLKAGEPGGPKLRSLRRLPIRRDVYADQTGWSDAGSNPFVESDGFNQRAEWMSTFSEHRMIWSAAWIDCRDALTSAMAAVLAVPDAARRAELREDLLTLPNPMTQADWSFSATSDFRAARKSSDDATWFLTEAHIKLVNAFRAHYHAVERQAQQP